MSRYMIAPFAWLVRMPYLAPADKETMGNPKAVFIDRRCVVRHEWRVKGKQFGGLRNLLKKARGSWRFLLIFIQGLNMRAIVTGHSRGLGAAIVAELLLRTVPVLGISRARNTELEGRFPVALQQCELDLADIGSVERWLAGTTIADVLCEDEEVILVNNAGTVQPVGPLHAQDIAAIGRAVTLNVATPMMLAGAIASAACRDRKRARILHISSGAARSAISGWSTYCATKAALDHHARTVAEDGHSAIRICSLAPGVIDTDMQAEIRATPVEQFPLREHFQALKQDGGLSSAEECARHLVDYLLSDAFGSDPVADLREVAAQRT